jgi:hypothetical protein
MAGKISKKAAVALPWSPRSDLAVRAIDQRGCHCGGSPSQQLHHHHASIITPSQGRRRLGIVRVSMTRRARHSPSCFSLCPARLKRPLWSVPCGALDTVLGRAGIRRLWDVWLVPQISLGDETRDALKARTHAAAPPHSLLLGRPNHPERLSTFFTMKPFRFWKKKSYLKTIQIKKFARIWNFSRIWKLLQIKIR